MSSPIYALILAGGSGERFWPLSRQKRPKQLLSLVSEETLIESTLSRLAGLVPVENILILTNTDQETGLRELLPEFPAQNIVAEPAKRDTAAAIALAVGWVSARAEAGTMIVLPADHVIADTAGFQQTLRVAAAAAQQTGELVTIGIQPTWACPGFGYIEQGSPISIKAAPAGPAVFGVKSFREKPSAELAQSFLDQGNFRWNAGMFIWTLAAITGALERHTPALATFVRQVRETQDLPALLREIFPTLPKISIDYALLEKEPRVWMVEAGFDWDDVGSWPAIAKYLEAGVDGTRTNSPLAALNAPNNIVYSSQKTLVALMGVRDLIVVQTADALLICHRDDAEKIKHLVAQIPVQLQ